MNPLLLQMISARATTSGNSALLEMVSRIQSGNGSGAMLDPQEIMARISSGNPLVAALAKNFTEAQSRAAEISREPVIDVEPEPEIPEEPIVGSETSSLWSAEIAELRQQIENLSGELQIMRERSDLLAAALGACCLCWGRDPMCRACRGRGRPGYAIPDEPLAREFVLPAIRTLRAQRSNAGREDANLESSKTSVETMA